MLYNSWPGNLMLVSVLLPTDVIHQVAVDDDHEASIVTILSPGLAISCIAMNLMESVI